ncbi:SbmA/BacA-like family transporter [Mesorhizobium sp. BAC0120]|uniref:ABC transporter ATP-binding protein/permease n=1 Tax=Mesorhizobium sp. BAC0120 TaxID=3090670 RepID=UPI00298CFC9B|nr:SbmA/BacA-like family transporter [Mesorhizobium sp. BAC0120]MDW6021011.1 SbmA/BacA-like family transporter [Mesorhizobium sp. BAC0120]
MDRQRVPLKVTWARFVRAVRNFASSEVGGRAKFMAGGLFALLCGLSGLNVVNSYVGRNFMTAIADRQTDAFIRLAILYLGVFAALTLVGVFARFAEERLALLWREFITRRAVTVYLADGTYYRLDASGQLTHPDQRMADDVRTFTITTLSFVLMVFNSSLTVLTFSGVLWSINPLLFVVAVLYAACGSYLTIALGRPLINLNYDQLDKEASFRSGLIHVRESAEPILLARDEERQKGLLLTRLEDLVANFRRITSINRNVGFFTTGYNWLIQIIPALIVAPAFIKGEIEFGVITQSAAAFAVLVGAFSLIVTQFQSISNFAAVVARISSLIEAIEKAPATPSAGSTIEIVEREGSLTYQGLTLLSSRDGPPLIKSLSVSIPGGGHVLLAGPNKAPGTALFRATAGIPTPGAGRIIRPRSGDLAFLAQRPYLPPGTLRGILVRPEKASDMSDDRILGVLRELGIEELVSRAGGLDGEQAWATSLSLTEQQLLALAGAMLAAPRFVFLDRVDATLGPQQLRKTLQLLSERSITCVNNGEPHEARGIYSAVLEFSEDGGWTWTETPA